MQKFKCAQPSTIKLPKSKGKKWMSPYGQLDQIHLVDQLSTNYTTGGE